MPDTVVVKAPDGTLGTVDRSDIDQMPEGSTFATSEDIRQKQATDKLEAEYGGISGGFAAAGLGALRGASLGLSDPLIAGLGGERARKALEGYQSANPLASTAGEIGGVVLPALVGDEAGLLNAPGRLVGGAGRAAESAATRIVGREAESVLGRVGQRALASAAGMGAEGAIYGVGNEISDAAIHDHELTAEKLWAGAGKGALLGAGMGAAAGTVGQLVREGAGALTKAAGKSETLGGWLEKQSLEATGRAAGVNKKIARKAEAYGDFDQMRRTWRDDAPSLVGKRDFGKMTTEDLAQASSRGLERDGAKQMGALAKADEALAKKAPEAFPKAVDVIGDLDSAANKLESTKLGSKPVVNRLRELADQARQMTGLVDQNGQYVPGALDSRWTLSQAHEFRVRVDSEVGQFTENMTGLEAALSDVRNGLEKRIVDGVESAGGEALKNTYVNAKQKMQAWYTLRDATKNSAAGGAANQFFGLSEKLGGIAGGVIGHGIGGPLGGLAGSAVGSLAAHAVRARGDFLAADLLGRVSQLGALERANAVIDKQITAGVKGFLGRTAIQTAEIGASQATSQKRAIRVAQNVTALANDDHLRTAHVAAALQGLDNAPSVAAHAALKAQQSIVNLAQHAPKPYFSSISLTPMQEKLRYSPQEVYQYSRYIDGYEEPMSVLSDLSKGRVDPMKLLAVQENHPRIWEQMHDTLLEELGQQDEELSWDQKKLAAIFFGIPSDEALAPDFVQRMQASAKQGYQQPQQQGGGGQDQGQQMGGRRPMDLDANAMFAPPSEQLGGP